MQTNAALLFSFSRGRFGRRRRRRSGPLICWFTSVILGLWIITIFMFPWPEHPFYPPETPKYFISQQKNEHELIRELYAWNYADENVVMDRQIPSRRREYISLDEIGFYWRSRVVSMKTISSSDEEGKRNTVHGYDKDINTKKLETVHPMVKVKSDHVNRIQGNNSMQGEKCVVPENAKWMITSFPTCNYIHEIHLSHSLLTERTRIIGHGYWRDVWFYPDSAIHSTKGIAIKTLKIEHDFSHDNYERHRRDALAHERLTSSPNVVNMYGFCGHSGFYEFSADGTLSDRLEEHIMAAMAAGNAIGRASDDDNTARLLDPYEKLRIAHQVALALADVHDTNAFRNRMGEITSAAIVHADIKADQYINFDGVYKLNDFNRCRFMRQKLTTSDHDSSPCGFTVQRNPSVYRSPEEYAYEVETEKIDIFSMGNIFYTLLADQEPWEGLEEKSVQQMILLGERPPISQPKLQNLSSVDETLHDLMNQCFNQEPTKRPRARTVSDTLKKKLRSLATDN